MHASDCMDDDLMTTHFKLAEHAPEKKPGRLKKSG
jgi:hypothetical protein